jgi:predicted aspartyl protease
MPVMKDRAGAIRDVVFLAACLCLLIAPAIARGRTAELAEVPGIARPDPPTPAAAAADSSLVAPPTVSDELAEVVVQTREARFVAPTRRDQIGRIWAPVWINGHGPFRLVLDTGASHTAVTSHVAESLGLPFDRSPPVLLRGVTGSATVPTIRVDTLVVGDLSLDAAVLPIVPDALGGAEGILGGAGLADKRIFIDFRHDRIVISYSRGQRAGPNFQSVPFHAIRDNLIVVDVRVGSVRTKAIIDTGGEISVANLALRDALARRHASRGRADQIMGATLDIQDGEVLPTPAIEFGALQIRDAGVIYADAFIFRHWKLTDQPAILIGMDALGLLDTLIIDYRRHELQLRIPAGPHTDSADGL